MNPEKIVSAQVVLAAAGGARPGPRTLITTENIREWMPSPETTARVSTELRNMGFEIGQAVGNSISITGPARLFESVFHTKLREVGGVQFADGYELPAEKVPPALRAEIVAVTFTPPPDFGPGAP
jgi:hypothetical protein